MFTANILEVFASFLYLRHICMLKGVLFSLFPSSVTLILRPTVKSPHQYWYLGLGYCLLSNALICAFVLSPKVSSYQRLKNCHRSTYPRGICSIVIPAAYLNAEGCIVFTFHFVSKPHISVYNIVSSTVLISGLYYCLFSNAVIWACIDSLGELLLSLQSYLYSEYPRGVCSIVIPTAYLYDKGCIIFIFHFVCKTPIRVYNIVSSAILISGLEYCLLSNALFLASVLTP